MIKSFLYFVEKITNVVGWLVRPFITEKVLNSWKPIHLCRLFLNHNKPIPRYFIGGTPTPPVVSTDSVTSITTNSGLAAGTATRPDNRAITEYGFAYLQGTTGDPRRDVDSTVFVSGDVNGSYTMTISGLSPSTTYRVAAYAVNIEGTSHGTTIQFTTLGLTNIVLALISS